jgi:hypothetical protein
VVIFHTFIKEYHQEGIKDCNFDKFLSALSFFIGGEANQMAIIKNQIETSISSIILRPSGNGKISDAVQQVHEKSKVLSTFQKINVHLL